MLTLGGCERSTTPGAGHRKMLEILEDIKNRTPDEYQYFGRKVHLHRRKVVEELGPGATD